MTAAKPPEVAHLDLSPDTLSGFELQLLEQLAVSGTLRYPDTEAERHAGYRLVGLKLAQHPPHGGAAVQITEAGQARVVAERQRRRGGP